MQNTKEYLHTVDGNDILTYPGLLYRIKKYYTDIGIELDIVDKRTPRVEPNIDMAMEGLYDIQKPIVYSALVSGGGIIQAPTGIGKTHMAAAIIRAYPRRDMLDRGTPISVFTCVDKDINLKNYQSLLEILPDRDIGIIQSGRKKIFTDDIMVVTLDSLHHVDSDNIGLLICDEVHSGVSDSRVTKLLEPTKAIRYGVSATPFGRHDNKDMVTESVFGPVVSKTSYQSGVDAGVLVPIKVIWVNSPEPPCGLVSYNSMKTRDGKVSQGVLRNSHRTKLVADILTAIPERMQTLTIVKSIGQINRILAYCDRDKIDVCHAESSEKNLKKKGFTYVGPVSAEMRRELYASMSSGDIRKMISTHVYKQGVDFPNLEVVISAESVASDIVSQQVAGRASRITRDKDRAYVIDFWHPWDFDPSDNNREGPLISMDKRRKRAYKNLGFDQVTCNTVEEVLSELGVESDVSNNVGLYIG